MIRPYDDFMDWSDEVNIDDESDWSEYDEESELTDEWFNENE